MLKLRKNDYAALIGLGVALRGQATVLRSAGQMDKFAKKIDDSEDSYRQALELDKNRGDAYYNLGLLYKDYRTNDPDQSKNIGQYRKAREVRQGHRGGRQKARPEGGGPQGPHQGRRKVRGDPPPGGGRGVPARRWCKALNSLAFVETSLFWEPPRTAVVD